MKHNEKTQNNYQELKRKLVLRFLGITAASFAGVTVFYRCFWFRRGGDWFIAVSQWLFRIKYEYAYELYDRFFRNNAPLIWIAAIIITYLILLRFVLNWLTNYFDMVNQAITSVLDENAGTSLPPEMAVTEHKLYELKAALKQRTLEARLAEQHKNDLVMYLAHDIRTPLTSVIGYLNLLAQAPDMPADQRAKYVNITLDKAYRLEKMINEFFEITRYHLQQIRIVKETIDLYYMLVQLCDELSPVLSANNNTAVLNADETLTVSGDPDKLARVFSNILRNAAVYSFPGTEIRIEAVQKDDFVLISFTNEGTTIPKEKLSSLFEKFYRMDESRTSNTGGSGLGLAIAKQIITLHDGTITAESENNKITFTIKLPR